nr:hypothetical protein [Methylobacterium sp. L1A1]
MSLSASRRGFLRGLTTLPLIGGGVALIGAPSAVAEPCTDATLDAYVALLAHEHRAALGERTIRDAERRIAQRIAEGGPYRPEYLGEVRERVRLGEDLPLWWRPEAPAIERLVSSAPPSSRAALVLSAVGAEWGR